tara:strand:+ start:1124 stop:2026 length:903 start_codon:yes stop_codon:yes gene_type:complete
MAKYSTQIIAKFACLYAGAIWGIFWIPLRAINEVGISGLWSSAIWFVVPTIILLPISFHRWRSIKSGGFRLQITAILSGLTLFLYTLAFLYTDVVRAMLLFYLTPIWSTLMAAFVLGESITLSRVIAIVLAALGMLIIFGLGLNIPIPNNIGDWLGLCSGITWAITVVRIRKYESESATDMTIGFFFWCAVMALTICLVLAPHNAPSFGQMQPTLVWLFPFMAIIVIPGAFASLWGPKFVSPGLASLLMMTEIIFGSITAALFANEPFGLREITGVMLIASASLVEPLHELIRKTTRNAA